LENVVVMDMSILMSVAERNKCIFISLLLRGAILHLCYLKMCGKVRKKSRNFIRVATLHTTTGNIGVTELATKIDAAFVHLTEGNQL